MLHYSLRLSPFFILILVAIIALSGLSFASQDRRPVPDGPVPETPVDPPTTLPCPEIIIDEDCRAEGSHNSYLWTDALGGAGNACVAEYNKCQYTQAGELAGNKAICLTVPGCTLKAKFSNDICEVGGAGNCNPPPGSEVEDPAQCNYICVIKGWFNYTNYRCDVGQAGEGEFTA